LKKKQFDSILKEETKNVFSFKFLKKKTCELIIEEYNEILKKNENIKKPNSM